MDNTLSGACLRSWSDMQHNTCKQARNEACLRSWSDMQRKIDENTQGGTDRSKRHCLAQVHSNRVRVPAEQIWQASSGCDSSAKDMTILKGMHHSRRMFHIVLESRDLQDGYFRSFSIQIVFWRRAEPTHQVFPKWQAKSQKIIFTLNEKR